MALTKYTYSKDANISVLTDEVLADAGITTALDHINLIDDADPDTVDIWFVDAISGAEETALDAVVSAHTNPAYSTESYERDDQEVGDTAIISTTSLTYVDMAGMVVTTFHHDDGTLDYQVVFNMTCDVSSANKVINIKLVADGVDVPFSERVLDASAGNTKFNLGTLGSVALANAKVIKIQWKISAGTVNAYDRCLLVRGLSG